MIYVSSFAFRVDGVWGVGLLLFCYLSVAVLGLVGGALPRAGLGSHLRVARRGPRRHHRALLCAHTYVARYRGVSSTPNARICPIKPCATLS